jgi:hypothetical protein
MELTARDVKALRRVNPAVSEEAASLVRVLVAKEDDGNPKPLLVPAAAWETFPNADELVVEWYIFSVGDGTEAAFQVLQGTLASTPPRLKALRWEGSCPLQLMHRVVPALSSLSSYGGLRELHLPVSEFGYGRVGPLGTAQANDLLALVGVIGGMPQLQLLSAPTLECSSEAWALLAPHPTLRDVMFRQLVIDSSAPQSAVTRLCLKDALHLAGEGALAPQGMLQRSMPQLEHLTIGYFAFTGDGYLAIQGHQRLEELVLKQGPRLHLHHTGRWPADGPQAWSDRLQLSSCPQLHKLDLQLHAGPDDDADALLAELGQCAALQELQLKLEGHAPVHFAQSGANGGGDSESDVDDTNWSGISRQGLEALAHGPAAASLRRCSLNVYCVTELPGNEQGHESCLSVREAGGLLAGRLATAEPVQVEVQVGGWALQTF